jgi:fucose permease
MTRSSQITTAVPVYVAALFQGLTLVSFPASSDVLKQAHGFTDAEYGAIFLPQVAAAILGALGGGALSGRCGLKSIFVLALLANIVSQALLALSAAVPAGVAYLTVLLGTGFLGLGFGMTGGSLNAYPRLLFPSKAGTALLVLHSTMGIGLSAGPLLVGWLSSRDAWLVFPIGLAIAGSLLTFASAASQLPTDRTAASELAMDTGPTAHPEFWLLAAIAVVYAFAEGTFSSWAVIFVRESRGLAPAVATSSLSAFWAALVVGRILVSGVLLRTSPLAPWSVLPLVILCAFLFIPTIATPAGAIFGFGLAGLGCSAFYPLTVATASARFAGSVAFVSSMLTAALMFGSGAASFIVGDLRAVLPLDQLYRLSAIYPTIVLGLVALTIRLIHTGRRAVA